MRKNFLKKLCVAAMAVVMTVGSAMSALADDEAVTFTEVTYKFECTTFAGNDTITLEAQASSWSACAPKPTYDVTATGAFEMKAVWAAEETGFKNMGYLASANGVDNVFELTSVVINDVEFVFQADATAMDGDVCKDAIFQTSTINANDGTMNGFPNIWNKAGQQAVIARSANGSTINGSSDDISITWVAADLPQPETTTAEETTTAADNAGAGETTTAATATGTPSTGDTAMVGLFVALAAVSAVVVLKKRTVTE